MKPNIFSLLIKDGRQCLKFSLLIMFVLLSNVAYASESGGTVCLGKNMAKPASEHSKRLYLSIDDSENIYFLHPYRGPRIVAQNLDTRKNHVVKVYFDNKVVQSWVLNFSKLETNSVLIWRAAGSWRMEPNEASSCK